MLSAGGGAGAVCRCRRRVDIEGSRAAHLSTTALGTPEPDWPNVCEQNLAGLEVIGDTAYAKIPGIVMEGLKANYQAAKSVARCQLMCDEGESPPL